MSFKVNNDLDRIKLNKHNAIHLFGSFVLALLFGFIYNALIGFVISYGLWILWEIGDGFKKHWTDYADKHGGNWIDYIRKETLFADYFSFQDAFVWDLGSVLGALLVWILGG